MSGHEKMQKGTKTTYPQADRRGQGSLRGRLDLSGDWDSDETNDAIAAEFEGEAFPAPGCICKPPSHSGHYSYCPLNAFGVVDP